ncbi:hypothetical protein M8994_03920 [Brucella sp. 21LCYQ03]|nr:hypothetical protein [Brucella sp. 21LCYQ03]
MLKWFWPALTWTAALTSLALWFGADRVEADIAAQTGKALSPFVWAGFDVDGRDVVLKGMAPDVETQKAAVEAVQNIQSIGALSDLTTVLQAVSPYVFKLTKNGEGIVLSGFIPENSMRDAIMNAAELTVQGGLVDDEMALARGATPEFQNRVMFIIDIANQLAEGEIELSEAALSVNGKALNTVSFNALKTKMNASLPYSLTLSGYNITNP